MEIVYQATAAEFTESVEAFFKDKPTTFNGIPTIRLIIWLDPTTSNFVWYVLTKNDVIRDVVEYSMGKKMLIPVGCTLLTFETREDQRVHLTDALEASVHGLFDQEEVLNGTIPYFMQETFGYELKAVKVCDLTKN
ncbi:MAG: hypothetical protein WA804_23405 [Terriglobales bacterium]